jgi:hypothetical protein
MTINPVFHARNKNIELDYHFIHERVALGLLNTQHLFTNNQVVDIFTKTMLKVSLSYFKGKLCLKPRYRLRGGVDTSGTRQPSMICGSNLSDKETERIRMTMMSTLTNQPILVKRS